MELFKNSEEHPFITKISDHHVFIRFHKSESNFWSPQLQIEIVDQEEDGSIVYGLFGPNPTLWTFFMFIHFVVATLFIIIGTWAYSSHALEKPYGLQIGLMIFMVIIWIALYFFGRAGKRKGKPQMQLLHQYLMQRIGIHTKDT
ncbi:GTP-binding protein [Arenibacter latericius]|uniref:GTP-binding protein n=1 Tax=Arenibacter latericius TaxID=86104 RepID=UPI001F0A8490|nr:GTP-binding protein [Arenibacter latericius]MDX1364191.1 GTP-binding protein [Arenibacter latericius]